MAPEKKKKRNKLRGRLFGEIEGNEIIFALEKLVIIDDGSPYTLLQAFIYEF